MEDEIPSWLPDLILLDAYKGHWDTYIETVYAYFHNDFVENAPSFQQRRICVRYHPHYQEKGATFWHLVSEGKIESERTPDLRRCERIRWPKPMIQHANSIEVPVWETIRPWKGQMQRRINFSLDSFSYIIVIAETNRGFDLVTSFFVKEMHRREKFRKEYEDWIKKGGSAG
ncbi:MAG: hypothetical protein JSR46_06665 [Verrucomicrobia bacterium]|nr:hypothetical protein [Verrucomicrobiota bacterium]